MYIHSDALEEGQCKYVKNNNKDLLEGPRHKGIPPLFLLLLLGVKA